MVKCGRCGVNIDDSFEICPNCGNNLKISQEPAKTDESSELKCSNCGVPLVDNEDFCSNCGTKVEIDDSNICEACGSEIPIGVLFCPTCGTKVKQMPKSKICSNCGFQIEEDVTFCPECGANVITGKKSEIAQSPKPNQSFMDKINFNSIIKPTIVSLVAAIILSVILVLIGFSWVSFVISLIIIVGIFAALIDNEANAMMSGFFVGLILGLLENPIIQFCFGKLAAKFYEWFFGGQILLLIILGIIIAYVANVYLKSTIQGSIGKYFTWL